MTMILTLAACATLPTDTASDRLRPMAVDHAQALADGDIVAARKTGVTLLNGLAAWAGW